MNLNENFILQDRNYLYITRLRLDMYKGIFLLLRLSENE